MFALSARIHAVSEVDEDNKNLVTVRSPQFAEAEWKYNVLLNAQAGDNGDGGSDGDAAGLRGGVIVTAVEGSSKNVFVEYALRYTLSYLSSSNSDFASTVLPGAVITIYADNDYYSQPSSKKSTLPRFNNLNVPITAAHKTGLGSSAALTTALVACILTSYSGPKIKLDLLSKPNQRIIHNLAQASHCAAQGKVGSGFDVAAAVFGSCVYRRFSPSVLQEIGNADSEGFSGRLKTVVDKSWDMKVEKTRVPPGLRLIMCDVDCGSSTPGMVRKLLSWKKENEREATARWDTIEDLNKGLIDLLDNARKLSDHSPGPYSAALQSITTNRSSENITDECSVILQNISQQIELIRSNIRAMGEAAGVPIEPPAQTKLIDHAIDSIDGVLGGVVPGAGGYDAVVFLAVDTDATFQSLEKFLSSYKFEGGEIESEKHGGNKGKVEALKTREECEGIKREEISLYHFYDSRNE